MTALFQFTILIQLATTGDLKHLNPLDYIVVLCYLFMVGVVGVYFSKFNKDADDYFMAGGKLPWIISSISLFVSGFSAFMFVAASGFIYRTGMSTILVFSSAFGAYWLGYFIFGKLWRRSRISSPMEFLTRRYSQSTTYYYSLIAIVPNIFVMGALIYTLCIFISSALGFNQLHVNLGIFTLSGFQLTLIAIGVVLLLYTVLGGLWAVAITDALQFLILFIMSLIIFPLAFIYLGHGSFFAGFKNLAEHAPPGYLSISTTAALPALYILAFWIQNMLGYNVNWHIGQRYYSISDERDTKKMAALTAILSIVSILLWILPVLVAKVIFPDMNALWPSLTEPTEASFVSLCLLMLPNGFLGVVVSAMLAASMSSADTTFNWLAAVITKDIYVPISTKLKGGQAPSDRLQLIVGKSTVFVVGIIAILISMSMSEFGSAFDISLKIYSVAFPAMLIPVFIGLMYRKTPWWSAIASSFVGFTGTLITDVCVNLYLKIPIRSMGDIFTDVSLPIHNIILNRYEINIFIGTILTVAVLLLSSFWPNKKEEDIKRLEAFDNDLRTPAYGEGSSVDLQGIKSYRIVGYLSALIGLLLMILAIIPTETGEFTINFIAGLGAILFGGIFWLMARYYEKKYSSEAVLTPSVSESEWEKQIKNHYDER